MKRLLLLLLAALPLPALAEYHGPAVATCRAFGERELKKAGSDVAALAFDNDRHLLIERVTRKLGSQFVASALSGNGAILRRVGPAVELSFVCLLADEKRALYFHWTPRRHAPSLAQCRRGKDPGACLQLLHDIAERDLLEASALSFQASLDADAKAGNDSASGAYRNAAAAWRAYRDAECLRRGAAGSDPWRACMVDLMRRQYLDLQ
jgi:lysozyme inhibitor LprI